MAERAKVRKLSALQLVEVLEERYGAPPFNSGSDPTEELVSCILSQHTSDVISIPAFERLRDFYPDWDSVIDQGVDMLASVIAKAGLANPKSKAIIGSLRKIKELRGDYDLHFLKEMPMLEARDWLIALPGVGPKTASIVLCFSLNMGVVPVDTHVFRVGWRIGLFPEAIGENKAHDVLLKLVPANLSFRFHMALLEHGRAVCRAPLAYCSKCPITESCRWFVNGGPEKRKLAMEKAKVSLLRRRQESFKKGKE